MAQPTSTVAMLEGPPQRWRNRPGPSSDFPEPPILVVTHHHDARVAREAPRRFRGNARAVGEYRLPSMIRIIQHRGIHMNHHLIPLSGRAGIESLMECRHPFARKRPSSKSCRRPPKAGATSPSVLKAPCDGSDSILLCFGRQVLV